MDEGMIFKEKINEVLQVRARIKRAWERQVNIISRKRVKYAVFIQCILSMLGRVTVLRWKLDMVSQREIRTEGLFAALNDCLYRSMYDFSYVALIDLDEIVMPKHNDTIQQFIE